MRDAVIVDAVRTPIGKRNGALRDVHPVDLSAHVLRELASRVDLDPASVDDVMWGCVSQIGDQSTNVARMAVLAAGWPESVPGVTVDRACGSSQQSVHFAVGSVMSGLCDVVVAGGVESMSRVPLGAARESGDPGGPMVRSRYEGQAFEQGPGAEFIARRWQLTRADLDAYALESHARTAAAADSGAFAGQLVRLELAEGKLDHDEGVRRDSSMEKLAGLRPAFSDDGVVTAGNSSQISDGAAALLITTSEVARARGWQPLARFHAGTVAAADPVVMLTAPIPATETVLRRARLGIDQIGVFEVNEAFASVPLAWAKEFGVDHALLNPQGGAIAVGHPLGASGAILMTRMVHRMRDQGLRYGLQTMCERGGMANATILELVDQP